MKKIKNNSYFIRSRCPKVFTRVLFIAVLPALLTSTAFGKQCVELFEPDYTAITFQHPQKLAGMVSEKMNVEWSEGSHFLSLSEGNHYTVFSALNGQRVYFGQDRPLFDADGSSFSIFSKSMKTLYSYSMPDLIQKKIEIAADHIVDIRSQFVIAQKNGAEGYFIFSKHTGELLHHQERAHIYIKSQNQNEATFVTEPSLFSGLVNEKKGMIESISLPSLLTGIHVGDAIEAGFGSDNFIKIKSGLVNSLVRRSSLTEHRIANNFLRAYEIDQQKNIYAIQTTDQVMVYKNGVLQFNQVLQNSRDLKIIAYSEAEAVYLAYDSHMGKLMTLMPFGKTKSVVEFGPSANVVFFRPQLVSPGTIMYQGKDGKFYFWHLRNQTTEVVSEDLSRGISKDSRYMARYDKKISNWVLTRISSTYTN